MKLQRQKSPRNFYPPALASGNLIQTSFDDGIYFYPPALASGNVSHSLTLDTIHFYPPALASGNLIIYILKIVFDISIHPLLRAGMRTARTPASFVNFYPPALASGNGTSSLEVGDKVFLSTRSCERE